MEIATKTVRPKVEHLVASILQQEHGLENLTEMLSRPTMTQRCFRCGEHFGFVCVCTPEELQKRGAK